MNFKTEEKWVWCEWTHEPILVKGFYINRLQRNSKDYGGRVFLSFIENGEYMTEYPEHLVYDNGMEPIQKEMNRIKFLKEYASTNICSYNDELKRLERLRWK